MCIRKPKSITTLPVVLAGALWCFSANPVSVYAVEKTVTQTIVEKKITTGKVTTSQFAGKIPTDEERTTFRATYTRIQEKMAGLKTEIEALTTKVTEFQEKVKAPVTALNDKQTADTAALDSVEKLIAPMESIGKDAIRVNLTANQTKIVGWQDELKKAFLPYAKIKDKPTTPASANLSKQSHDDLQAEIANFKKLNDDLEASKNKVTESGTKLKTTVESTISATKALITRLQGRCERLVKLDKTADPDRVRIALAAELGNFASLLKNRQTLKTRLVDLEKAFKTLKDEPVTLPADLPKEWTTDLDRNVIKVVAEKLESWLDAQISFQIVRNGEGHELWSKFLLDPKVNASTIAVEAKKVTGEKADYDKIVSGLGSLLEVLQSNYPTEIWPKEATLPPLVSANARIGRGTLEGGVLITLLTSEPSVDKSTWISEGVQLYYFDDVARLMKVLHRTPALIGDGTATRQKATDMRTALDEATVRLLKARQAVNDARTKLETHLQTHQDALSLLTQQANRARSALIGVRSSAARQREVSRAAQENVARLTTERDVAQARLDRANTSHLAAQTAATNARQAADTNTDTTKQARLDSIATRNEARESETRTERDAAQNALDAAELRLSAATGTAGSDSARVTEAEAAASQQQQRVDQQIEDLKLKETTLRQELQELQNSAQEAESEVRTAAAGAYLLANQENAAYIAARGDSPFYIALPSTDTRSSDPLDKVTLYGFPNDRSILIRGAKEDVNRVREMIAKFDKPYGQALLTLWTLELSSDGTDRSNRELSKNLEYIEAVLQQTRTRTNRTNSILRECLSETIEDATLKFETRYPFLAKEIRKEHVTPLAFYDPDVLVELGYAGVDLKNLSKENDDLQAISSKPKGPERTAEVSRIFAGSILDPLFDTDSLRVLLPRTSTATTTTAEAMVLLSLGKREHQEKVLKRFQERYEAEIFAPTEKRKKSENSISEKSSLVNQAQYAVRGVKNLARGIAAKILRGGEDEEQNNSDLPFEGLRNFIGQGLDEASFQKAQKYLEDKQKHEKINKNKKYEVAEPTDLKTVPGADMLALRREVIGGLQRNAIAPTIDYIDSKRVSLRLIAQEKNKVSDQIREIETKINNLAVPLTLVELTKLDAEIKELREARLSLDNDEKKIKNDIWFAASFLYKTRFDNNVVNAVSRVEDDFAANKSPEEMAASAGGFRDLLSNVDDSSVARTAALNEMLKRLLQTWEDDMQAAIVRPLLSELRREVTENSSMNVGALTRTSVLTANRLPARVDPKASAQLAVGTEQNILQDVLQLAKIGATIETGGALATIGVLNQQPKEAPPAVYGITTGNLFEVHPITDPTGQAMRFQLDYTAATQIQEPNGSINPQLNRIERHTVNAPVQLSNQEIRLISRFESNVKLGLPVRTSGGIPILKDIPGVREIPLLGWFVKRRGKAAMTQHSLLFAQTAMLPTANEVIGSLAAPPIFAKFTERSIQSDRRDTTTGDLK